MEEFDPHCYLLEELSVRLESRLRKYALIVSISDATITVLFIGIIIHVLSNDFVPSLKELGAL